MTDAVIRVCPGCCGNTGREHLTNTGVGVGKRRPRKDSLRKLLLRLVWSSRRLCGGREGGNADASVYIVIIKIQEACVIKTDFGDKQVFSLAGARSQELRDW